MLNPKFLDGSSLRHFDIVVTNPMWNQDNFEPKVYENDPYERFEGRGGYAPGSVADWAWIQHVAASLKPSGRAAVLIDTGAASRGSGNQGDTKEKQIRKWFVERDLVEASILLPENLFYNTPGAGLIVMLNFDKPQERKGKVLLLNASLSYLKGRPKNFLTETGIDKLCNAFENWTTELQYSEVVENTRIAGRDFNLLPSAYIDVELQAAYKPFQQLLDDTSQALTAADKSLKNVEAICTALGFEWRTL
jgi:type I restriction enzyme M protein